MVLDAFGGPENFREAKVADPVPGCGEVLVRVEGSSVNPIDVKLRSGALPALAPDLPAILHGDVVGRVEAVGCGVKDWAQGDRVWACGGGFKGLGGALGELMVVDSRLLARAPACLTVEEAAALPLVAITAWQAVVERGQVRLGQRVLVHGGAGGVGHVAVQFAKAAGAWVMATVSSEAKADVVRGLGADEVWIGREAPESAFDVVVDTVGGENLAKTFRQIRPGGVAVTIAARTTADLTPLHGKSATFHAVFMALPLLTGEGREKLGVILERVGGVVEAGDLHPVVDRVFPITEVAAAHRRLESGEALGKIVLWAGW